MVLDTLIIKLSMETKHLFNEKIYLVTNHVVAGNPLFYKSYYCKRFIEKIDLHLSPLCEILSFGLIDTEFQLIVKLKDRKTFKTYYLNRRKKKRLSLKKIPHSAYIFSQAMANLQSSMAIHFNRKENRSGAVFARRYRKIWIGSESSIEEWKKKIKRREKIHQYSERWCVGKESYFRRRFCVVEAGKWYLGSEEGGARETLRIKGFSRFCLLKITELQGHFENPPPKQVSTKELKIYLEIRHNISIKR